MSAREWRTYKWGELCTLEYGKALKGYRESSGSVPVYGTNGPIGYTDKELSNREGVIIGRKGAYRGVHYSNKPFFVIDTAFYLNILDESKLYMKFAYYNLLTKDINSMDSGSAIPSTSRNDFYSLESTIPPIEEQKRIASILSNIDNKIEVNIQVNKNLEEIAQSIFKRWFIDFEFPNENGEPYKSSGGEMVESEIGLIPNGWSIVKLAVLGNIITGKTPSSKQIDSFGEKYNFITPRDMNNSIYILKTERLLSEIGSERLKTIRIKKNSIGVSCIGSNLGEVYINDKEGFTNQQINSIILDKEQIYPYVYITLKNMKEDFLNLAGGSAVPIINKTAFSSIKIIMPDESILNKFVEAVTCLFEKVKSNLIENRNLTEVRDTLLPKLMSGEIRVHLKEI